jgi:hypothetical protein
MRDNHPISEGGSSLADESSSNPGTTRHHRRKACHCCRARKVKCRAANDGSSDRKCCVSRMYPSNKSIPHSKSRLQRKDQKPYSQTKCSTSREDGQELPPEALEGLKAMLHLSTITSNERRLLLAFLPPEPKTQYLDLNAFMRGQVIPNTYGHELFTSNAPGIPMNDFDFFFSLEEGAWGDRAGSTPQSRSSSWV